MKLEETGNEPSAVATLSLKVDKPGRHALIVTCEDKQSTAKSQLHVIEITGPAAVNSAVLRKRWRPAAAHTKFSSSHIRDWQPLKGRQG
jgi:hypothetical protein